MKANAKPGKNGRYCGVRYKPAFYIECLMLKLKSTAAFRHLRDELLPLPSMESMRKIISSSDCSFGFNNLALQHIQKALAGLPEEDRWGSFTADEMTVKKDISWDARNLVWRGISDFGGETKKKVSEGIADKALVFMFRPYKHAWAQPFACFASKGGASGEVLHELIVKGICALFTHAGIVKNVTADGYSCNKNAFSLLGADGTKNGKHYFLHPLDVTIKIYCFTDPPHLLKCAENNMEKHKTVQVFILTYIF